MSQLKTRVAEDIKSAMRARETERLSVLRMLSAELKQREVVESTEITDAVVQSAVEKMIKQRRDSERQFRDAGRNELADKEAAEIDVLMAYLPQQFGDAEISALIAEAISTTGAAGPKDIGKVMSWIKPKAQGRTDMAQLSARIKAALG